MPTNPVWDQATMPDRRFEFELVVPFINSTFDAQHAEFWVIGGGGGHMQFGVPKAEHRTRKK
jgi:hypothetical protein